MNDSKKIKLLLEALIMNPHQLAKSLGYDQASIIYNIINGRNKISSKLMRQILDIYPNISKDWLINGEGPILKFQSSFEDSKVLLEESTDFNTNINFINELRNLLKIIEEKDKTISEKDKLLIQKDKLIDELQNKILQLSGGGWHIQESKQGTG